jgi:serine/threonine protein kinase
LAKPRAQRARVARARQLIFSSACHLNNAHAVCAARLRARRSVFARVASSCLAQVTELLDTDLHYIIHSKQALTDDHIQYFVYQILRGLKCIHAARVLHRDLKVGGLAC